MRKIRKYRCNCRSTCPFVIQRVFHGKPLVERSIADFSHREVFMMAMMMVVTVYLGVYPQPALEMATQNLASLMAWSEPVAGSDGLMELAMSAGGNR